MLPRTLLACALAIASCEPAQAPSDAPRPLRTRWVGEADGSEPLVVFIHGYGAPGDDLVGRAEEMSARLDGRVRFVLPEAPLPGPGGGLAWWPLDLGDIRPSDRGAQSPRSLPKARRDVGALLDQLRASGRLDPNRTVIAGFSQGAMLAMDVALHWDAPLAGVAMLSGGPIDEAGWIERMRTRRPPPTLITHGLRDPLLAFDAAARLRTRIEEAQGDVTFYAFDGAHGIPPGVIEAFDGFLRARLLAEDATVQHERGTQ